MGQVVDINSQKSGYVKYLHKTGWEKGYKIRGKWNGFYECIGILPNSDITVYAKGNFNMGLRVGRWEISYIDHNRENPIKVHTGRYEHGKKHGVWNIHKPGQVTKEDLYKKGILVDQYE